MTFTNVLENLSIVGMQSRQWNSTLFNDAEGVEYRILTVRNTVKGKVVLTQFGYQSFVFIAIFVLPPLAVEIGFTQATVKHNEEERQFMAIIERDRPSELEYIVDFVISTPNTGDERAATPDRDFRLGDSLSIGTAKLRITPTHYSVEFPYQIIQDNMPEFTELIQISSISHEAPTFLCDADPMFQFNGRDCFRDLQIRILDDDGESLLFFDI